MAKLGDVCKFQSGGTPSKSNDAYYGGTIPWITTVALNGTVIDAENAVEWITDLAIEESAAKIVPANSIMVGTRVGVGKTAINTIPMSTSQDIISLLNIDETRWYKPFLCKFILAKGDYLNSQARGATIKGIKIEVLEELELPDIPINQQKHIATIIDQTDTLISLRKQQIAKLDELVKARFVEMFGDPIKNRSKKKLSEIGRIFTGNTPSMKEPAYYDGEDIPFIKPGDLKEIGVTNIEGIQSYISEKARPVARIIPSYSVLVTCIGTIGKIGITTEESACNQQINFIVPNKNTNSVYLAYCLTFFKEILLNMANAPVVPIINKTQFSELEIPVFSLEQQNQFAAFVAQTDQQKLTIQHSLAQLELLKKALMQKYFG